MEWKTAWSYLPLNWNTCIGTACNITQRTFFRNNINGAKIKIKFSNKFSKKQLILENVVIGKKERTKAEITGTEAVTYKGCKKIVIAPANEFYSDEIDFPVSMNDDIVISVYLKETTEIFSVCTTWFAGSWHTIYGCNGNFISKQKFTETDSSEIYPAPEDDQFKSVNLLGISEIKVYTDSDVKTIALFGDSITHMSYYGDALIEKMYACYPGKITIVNRGISGNRLLRDYKDLSELKGGGTVFGEPGIKRFYHDIYSSDRPEYILLLIGINDIMHPFVFKRYDEIITTEEYINGMTELVNIAHKNGSKIMIGTITPFRHEDADWFGKAENLRRKVNAWIRRQSISDGIMDFDIALRNEEKPEYMLDDCHLGDGLHPNYKGGQKMADTVPMEWFK